MPGGLLLDLDTPIGAFLFNVQTISKMKSKSTKAVRHFYSEWLATRENHQVYSHSLRARVTVNSSVSRRETSHYAAINPLTMQMVLTAFDDILRYARKTGEFPPKPNSGQSRFVRLINLEREVKGLGVAKLTVGELPDGKLVQYCITAVPAL